MAANPPEPVGSGREREHCMSGSMPPARPATPARPARAATLTRGINLSHWFAQAPSYDLSHIQSCLTAADLARIRSAGFVHVRLPLNPLFLLDPADPATLRPAGSAALDAAISMIMEHGLAVIVDLHPEDDLKLELAVSDAAVIQLERFWYALARHLAVRDPEVLFLEVLNEPVMRDGVRWAAVQRTLLAAMRAGAPDHTLIATGHTWSDVDALCMLEPVRDPNVVYNFHYYDPHTFSHQGATWGEAYWPALQQIPYPVDLQAALALLQAIPDEAARQALYRYGEAGWNAERIAADI